MKASFFELCTPRANFRLGISYPSFKLCQGFQYVWCIFLFIVERSERNDSSADEIISERVITS
ncbi:MAG: hypothetical protein ACD_67C00154G0004, partial [uncultured bacterium]